MSLDLNLNKILIIDFGSRCTQLIVRRIRELGIYSELVSHKKIVSKYLVDLREHNFHNLDWPMDNLIRIHS